MTTQNYVRIAGVIRYERKSFMYHPGLTEGQRLSAVVALDTVAESLAGALREDNPRFSRPTFLAACGVDEPVHPGMPPR